MGEADLPARERKRDLAVVHVAGEDEIEASRLELVEIANGQLYGANDSRRPAGAAVGY